jgi:hypothetical protein
LFERPPVQVSNARAIEVGLLYTRYPVHAVTAVGGLALALIPHLFGVSVPLLPVWFFGLVGAAWLLRSITVPKWRLWALERVNNWSTFEREAIAVGIIADEQKFLGKLLSRTEIWTYRDRERADNLLRRSALKRGICVSDK